MTAFLGLVSLLKSSKFNVISFFPIAEIFSDLTVFIKRPVYLWQMKRILLLFIGSVLALSSIAQEDWGWWNELHGWESGMPNWRSFIITSPGYLGPNALPVPSVQKGILEKEKSFEFSSDFHFRQGDNTQNIAGRIYYPFGDKIAVEFYWVMLEHYAMSDSIRDERFARDRDGKGIATGDLYFTTYIQLVKARKFPNTLLRMAGRTASGGHFDAARYSDSPGYYFDLGFSKAIGICIGSLQGLPFGSFGFYSWQTNDLDNLQNDALMYGLGFELSNEKWKISNSISGYSGYKNQRDQPMVYTFDVKKTIGQNAVRLQYLYGLHDWEYQTIKLSFLWQWK